MKVSRSSAIGSKWVVRIAGTLRGLRTDGARRLRGAAAAALLLLAPMAQAQIQNGGFESGNFSGWTLRDYNRGNSTIPVTSSAQLGLTATGTVSNGGNGTGFRSAVLTGAGTAPNTGGILKYPFSGNSSARLGDNGGLKGTSMEQVATMALSDVDPVDGKVHIRFAMAPVLNNPGHPANQQPFFFVEVTNQTKSTTMFTTFNYSNQPGIPWQSVGSYQFTNWQGFDIAPGNGLLDVGDQVLVKIYVSNCAQGAADHTGQVYVDVFGSRMPGLSVAATGPSTTKPNNQITYTYNYVNNSGVLAVDSRVRLAAPITENGLHLTFVPGSWPAGCTGPFAGTSPRADYIDCPVGDLNDGAGGSFNVTFTVPAGAATTSPNNVVNNGDYDIRASTVSPFIGPLVKTIILPSATPTVDLGITVNNGGIASYAVGGAVAYTVTVTNNGPIDITGAVITQTLTGTSGTASWTCAPAPGSTATCGAASGTGPISTTGDLPVGQGLVYSVSGVTAATAGTPVVTVVKVAPPTGTSDSVSGNNTDGLSTPVSAVQHTLTANTSGSGTGKITATPGTLACASPGGAACASQLLGEGQEAYLNAVADPGSVFKNWTGNCTTITGNQCYVKMGTTDLSVTAVFAKVWTVTPTIAGGTITPNSAQVVEDGNGTSFTITPGTPGQVPVITTPGGANTCPGTLTGPVAGSYTWTVSPVTEDCAFHVTFQAPAPKLSLAKTGPSDAVVGVPFDYVLTVTNVGSAAMTANATVTDAMPAGVAFDNMGGCAATGLNVSCTVAPLAAGASQSFTITLHATGSAVSPLSNTAYVTGGGDPACVPATPCASPTVTTNLTAPKLSLAKTGPSDAVVGVPFDYVLTVTNTGTAAMTASATVTDAMPAGLALDNAGGCSVMAQAVLDVTCNIAPLAAGASQSFTITVHATGSAVSPLSNTAYVTGGGDPACVPATPCASPTVMTSLTAPKLALAKTGPSDAVVGVPFDYVLTVTNTGTAATTASATVTDTLPANLAIDSAPGCTIAGQGVTCPVASLAAGAAASFTISVHATTAGNAINIAHVQGGGDPACTSTPCDSPQVPTAVADAEPALTVQKSVASTGPYGVGDTVAYSFLVTNTGNVSLSGIVINDAQLDAAAVCPATTLAPGATTTCTGSHTVTAAEVAAGFVHNSATSTGQPPTPPGGPTPPPITTPPSAVDTATEQHPAMTMVKSVASTGPYGVGDQIAYQFLVTNTGDVILSGIVINDAQLDAAAVCPATTLAPGASTTCTGSHTVTAAEVASGYVHNSATATGQPPTAPGGPTPPPVTTVPSEVDTPTAQNPALGIVKSVTSAGPYGVGDQIAYQFLVTNTGDVTLSGIVVNDAQLDAAAVCPATTLAPGATTTCTGSHTVAAAEVAAGFVHNSATATGQPPTAPGGATPSPVTSTPSAVDTPTAQNPAMTVVKSVASTGPYGVGSVIAYQFVVENTGDVILSGIVINDAQLDAAAVCPATTLAPGTSTTCTGSHTVTAQEVAAGYVHNSATATGQPPTPPGGPIPPPVTTVPSQVDTPTEQQPALTVLKSVASTGPYSAGSVIAYQFLVTNIGNVTLDGIVVNDAQLDAPAVCPVTTLNPGASTTCTGGYTVTAADVEAGNVHNVATATGTPPTVPGGPTPTPVTSEPHDVDTPIAQHPAIATAKTATLTVDNATPGKANIGDVITYAVTVTNTGDVTLNDVTVEDTMDGYAPTTLDCAPTTLVPGQTATCAAYTHTVSVDDANRAGASLDNKVVATGVATTAGSVAFSVTALGNAAVVVEPDPVQIRIVKSATPYDVKVGDLVRYTLAIQNTGTTPLVGGTIVDTPPAGFSYVDGSLAVDDADKAGLLTGIHPITVANIDLPAGRTALVTYLLRVGAGVRAGIHTNSALMRDGAETVSNVATASVQLSADPMLDESLVLGTVFDDRDGDGWQDSAALAGVKVQGGFAPGAYVAGSTTVDRGNGAQPEADASAPLLHGISLGAIGGRESEADLAAKHRVVVSQTLAALGFTDDFVLTSDEGVTVRMDAAGNTTTERAGRAAKGLTAAAPTVSRTVSQVADGYRVDYVIENTGIDERGIPGVRIASVEGLLAETDQFGRYHLTGLDGGRWERGRNFILKVDPATLPPGTVFSTDNPLLRRVTPGLPVRFDFGVRLPSGLIEGGSQPVELELGEVLFDPESATLRGAYLPVIEQMAAQIREHGAGEVVIAANGENEALAFDRAKAVRDALLAKLDPALAQATTVSLRTDLADPRSTLLSLGESPVLGTVLFDTDSAAIKPGFAPVIAKIAADIEALGGGVVGVVGHADRRGPDAYNTALGLRRAKAVYEAIAAKLGAQARSRLRVEINDDPTAPVGLKSR